MFVGDGEIHRLILCEEESVIRYSSMTKDTPSGFLTSDTVNETLNFVLNMCNINMDDVRDSMRKKEEERLLSKHKYEIFLGNDGRWKTTIPDETKPNGRRLIAKSTEEKLKKFLINFYAQIEDEEYIQKYDPKSATLEMIFYDWIKVKENHTNSSSYIRRIYNDWNKFYAEQEIASVPVASLSYLYLDNWLHKAIKEHQMTKKQYYNMSVIIRQCLEYCCEKEIGLLEENPMDRIKISNKMFLKKKKPSRETQVYLQNEQKLIAEECMKRFNSRPWCTTPLAVLLNFQLGLRIGELVALKWSDIDNDYIHIQRQEVRDYYLEEDEEKIKVVDNGYKIAEYVKSDAGDRQVYLNSVAKEILQMIKKVNFQKGYFDDNYIFIKSRHKTRSTSRVVSKYIEDLCISIGINVKSNHKIRKTYISSLFDQGLNIDTIRGQAGHEDERTSLRNYCFDQKDRSVIENQLEHAANRIAGSTLKCMNI